LQEKETKLHIEASARPQEQSYSVTFHYFMIPVLVS